MKKLLFPFTKSFFVGVLILLLSGSNAYSKDYVIGYFPTYSNFPNAVHSFDLNTLTHIYVAFINPDANGNISMPASLSTVVNTAHAKDVKVVISIGGGGDLLGTNYRSVMNDPNKMNHFINNLVQAVLDHNLDGVDVDIEGNILNGTDITAAQYETFVVALGNELRSHNKLMSAALGSWFGQFLTNHALQQFDFICAMAYDEYGTWTGPGQHSSYQYMINSFNYWINQKGIPAHKLVLGVPFYGYGWGNYGKAWKFHEIINTFPNSQNIDQIGEDEDVIYYNGIPTIQQKAIYAREHSAGVMIWELTQDATGDLSLMKVISEVFSSNFEVPDNIAKGKSVSASSVESPEFTTSNATDGNYSTRWSSVFTDNEWIYVDLQDAYNIEEVKITWEAAFARDYQLQISLDAHNWSTVKSVNNNTELLNSHVLNTAPTRYLRILCTKRATEYGYSIHEIEAYGEKVAISTADNLFTTERTKIYPNPASDLVTISGVSMASSIEIVNISGVVLQEVPLQNETEIDLAVSNYPAGIYLVKINHGRNSEIIKLTVY